MTMISARKAQQESLFSIYRYFSNFYVNAGQLEAFAIRIAKIHVTPVYIGHSTRH